MAAITYTDFIKACPEFGGMGGSGQAQCEQAIADAETEFNPNAFGSTALYVRAVRYRACALLASGRYGQVISRNVKPADEYEERLKEVMLLIPDRFLVV